MMHHAIEMLLARMESHPEDFSQERSGKWLQTINAYKKFFTEEEGIAVRDGLRKINMESMTEDIMKRMVKDEEKSKLDELLEGWADEPNHTRL
jgi:multimeric flavodoxin WrbA